MRKDSGYKAWIQATKHECAFWTIISLQDRGCLLLFRTLCNELFLFKVNKIRLEQIFKWTLFLFLIFLWTGFCVLEVLFHIGCFNRSLMWWGAPGNCSNHGEILEHPGGLKTELKPWNFSSLSEVFEISGDSHHTNEGLKPVFPADKKKPHLNVVLTLIWWFWTGFYLFFVYYPACQSLFKANKITLEKCSPNVILTLFCWLWTGFLPAAIFNEYIAVK